MTFSCALNGLSMAPLLTAAVPLQNHSVVNLGADNACVAPTATATSPSQSRFTLWANRLFLPLALAIGSCVTTAGCNCSGSNPEPESAPTVEPAQGRMHLALEEISRRPRLSETFHIVNELDGDPRLGRLIFLRNLHMPNHGIVDDEQWLALVQYQVSSLILMEIFQPRHFFIEGLTYDLHGEEIRRNIEFRYEDLDDFRTEYQQILDGLPLGEFSSAHYELVASFGAAWVYALQHPEGVVFHRTSSTEQERQIFEFLSQVMDCRSEEGDSSTCQDMSDDMIYPMRESWSTPYMIQFFRDHPGEEALLVYGGGHRFCDDFIREGYELSLESVFIHEQDILNVLPLTLPEPCTP